MMVKDMECTGENERKSPLILMKLGDLIGILLINIYTIFMSQFHQNLLFLQFSQELGSGLVTGLVTGK